MSSKAKVLDKVLTQIHDETVLNNLLDSMMGTYMREVHAKRKPKPVGKKNYVGIEVECFTNLERVEVMKLLLEYDLEKHVDIADDGSIDADFGESYELRILSSEDELPFVLKQLGKVFKVGKFGVNDTCGLHVHIDMRNRNFEKSYKKLLKFQHLMFAMVGKERWNSEYCEWSDESKKNERFTAVNRLAYGRHKTIEIRLHDATLDVKRIGNWIKLLLKAVGGKQLGEIKSKKDALKWAGKDRSLRSYIDKRFHKSWLESREKVMKGYQEYDEDDYNNAGGDEDYF